jgi:hypothetical protein
LEKICLKEILKKHKKELQVKLKANKTYLNRKEKINDKSIKQNTHNKRSMGNNTSISYFKMRRNGRPSISIVFTSNEST